jgi:lysozyme
MTTRGTITTVTITPALIAFLLKVEGERLEAYKDTKGVWTIGVGHTGPEVVKGLTITKDCSRALLTADALTACRAVDQLVRVPLTANQRIVLVSFVFNLGASRLKTSTILRLLNQGDYASVPRELARWNKETLKDGTVRVNPGLTNRRAFEITLWRTP